MRKITECHNERCHGDGTNTPWSACSEGYRVTCPYCGSYNVMKSMIPENADDVKVLRADYNRRHMHEPGFVPSVEYIIDPNDPTKRIPKREES
jgi:hypothetical protein